MHHNIGCCVMWCSLPSSAQWCVLLLRHNIMVMQVALKSSSSVGNTVAFVGSPRARAAAQAVHRRSELWDHRREPEGSFWTMGDAYRLCGECSRTLKAMVETLVDFCLQGMNCVCHLGHEGVQQQAIQRLWLRDLFISGWSWFSHGGPST